MEDGLFGDKIFAKYWVVPETDQFTFPEVGDLAYDAISNRPNYGIAFSGGGTVSAALAPGFLKALEDLGVMGNVKYISGVSGGSWGTAAYCYAQDENNRIAYFGLIEKPENLDKATLEGTAKEGSMTGAVTNAKIADLTIGYALKFSGHEAYNKAVGDIFLSPFGLNSKKHFTTDSKTLTDILLRNPHLKEKDFQLLYVDKSKSGLTSPYYIINGSILTPPKTKGVENYETFPFEFTPLYGGVKSLQILDDSGIGNIGGYYIESFGLNINEPELEKEGEVTVHVGLLTKKVRLRSAVGTSGSAVTKSIAESNDKGLTAFLPEFKYWNPNNTNFSETQDYLFGDGGLSEDTGITSLLSRGVDNIVLFITEPFDINPISKKCCEVGQRYYGYNQIAKLFGAPIYIDNCKCKCTGKKKEDCKCTTKARKGEKCSCTDKSNHDLTDKYDNNGQFFKTDDFAVLTAKFDALKKAGKPIIVTDTYEVLKNHRFGIIGGKNVNVTWVVVDTCPSFNESLPSDVFNKSTKTFELDGLENFPAICTFGQNKGHLIQLTPPQANLLANQAYWMVSNSEEVKTALTKTK